LPEKKEQGDKFGNIVQAKQVRRIEREEKDLRVFGECFAGDGNDKRPARGCKEKFCCSSDEKYWRFDLLGRARFEGKNKGGWQEDGP
jgi:hypothetical protein